RQTLVTKILLQKLLHLAAAFADQADDRDVGIDVTRQHREQHRFADAGTCKDAEPLTTTAGQERIERTDAEVERGADALARMRRRRRIAVGHRRRPLHQWPLP